MTTTPADGTSSPCAVVTGASSGIGTELARQLAGRYQNLVLVARRVDRLTTLAAELERRPGVHVELWPCDLGDRTERARLVEELRSREVAVLCSNAGFTVCGPVVENDPRRESAEVEVDVVATHDLVTAVLPEMVRRGRGRILLTGSNAGEQPVPTAATYAASKAFVNIFSQSVHAELVGTGVTCTLLEPGPVSTEFTRVGGIEGSERHRWMGWRTPQSVAIDAIDAMERGRRVVIPGTLAKVQAYGGRLLLRRLLFSVIRTVILPALRSSPRTADAKTAERAA